MAQKYLVLRLEDVRKYLTDEQKNKLVEISGAINAGRQSDMKTPGTDTLFVVNGRDMYGIQAIEKYISAIHDDEGPVARSAGVEDALAAAQKCREKSIMAGEPRLPS